MRNIVILPSFERSLRKLSPFEKKQAYELRASIRLRVVMKAEGDSYYLVFIGGHDQVKRYLRNYRG